VDVQRGKHPAAANWELLEKRGGYRAQQCKRNFQRHFEPLVKGRGTRGTAKGEKFTVHEKGRHEIARDRRVNPPGRRTRRYDTKFFRKRENAANAAWLPHERGRSSLPGKEKTTSLLLKGRNVIQ